MTNEELFLGRAIKYPLAIPTGKPSLVAGREAVAQSIRTILRTPIGTRFFLPDFGSRLEELMFEPNDEILEDMLRYFIFEAVGIWEKRVSMVDVSITMTEEVASCLVEYRVLPSNEIDSFIYPFYRNLTN